MKTAETTERKDSPVESPYVAFTDDEQQFIISEVSSERLSFNAGVVAERPPTYDELVGSKNSRLFFLISHLPTENKKKTHLSDTFFLIIYFA
jgi:hypothetical protein